MTKEHKQPGPRGHNLSPCNASQREQRRASALRENLKRRKESLRSTQQAPSGQDLVITEPKPER